MSSVKLNLCNTFNVNNDGLCGSNDEFRKWTYSIDNGEEIESNVNAITVTDFTGNVNYSTLHKHVKDTLLINNVLKNDKE